MEKVGLVVAPFSEFLQLHFVFSGNLYWEDVPSCFTVKLPVHWAGEEEHGLVGGGGKYSSGNAIYCVILWNTYLVL